MTDIDTFKVKLRDVLSLIVVIVLGVSSMIAMHESGKKEVLKESKEYTDIKVLPLENDMKEIKKKLNDLNL